MSTPANPKGKPTVTFRHVGAAKATASAQLFQAHILRLK